MIATTPFNKHFSLGFICDLQFRRVIQGDIAK
jgi:hypothetical protein